MKKRSSCIKRIAVMVLISFLYINPLINGQAMAADDKTSDEIYFLMQMESFLKTSYVNEVQDLELLRGAIKGMVESLNDPYSEYYTPSEFKDFNESTSGNFGGIGVVITSKDKYITAVSVLEGTPAEKVGIRPGDKLVEIDGDDITGISTAEVSRRLRGEKGSKVSIGILRDGEKQIIRFEVERDIIKVNPIDSKVLGQGIGYIKINEFNENTVENLDRTLGIFKKSGVVGIVLDLRNNPGGYLDQAVEVAARFIPKGPIVNIVSKEGKIQSYTSNSEPLPFKLVVLVNNGSASASEILAGAVKDRKAGVLIGEKTFGKGMVQRTLSLGALGGIKLTTAYYTTPNGTNINNTGIIPDVVIETDKTNPFQDFIPLNNQKTLSYGNVGLDVLGIQQRLKFLNLFNTQPDGVFGPRTEQAVKALQKQAGLSLTGIVDTNFYKAMDDAIYKNLTSREDIQLRKAIDILKEILKSKNAA
ncbi:MAG: S41 family peptidase [Tepidanaerobacteraceae bacterium]|jgi:carboxyl-terminal processing protease